MRNRLFVVRCLQGVMGLTGFALAAMLYYPQSIPYVATASVVLIAAGRALRCQIDGARPAPGGGRLDDLVIELLTVWHLRRLSTWWEPCWKMGVLSLAYKVLVVVYWSVPVLQVLALIDVIIIDAMLAIFFILLRGDLVFRSYQADVREQRAA